MSLLFVLATLIGADASAAPAADAMLALPGSMPIRVAGPHSIAIGPGSVTIGQNAFTLAKERQLEIPPVAPVQIRGERHDSVPAFNPQAPGWIKGFKLSALVAKECSATGLLDAGSVVVRAAPDGPPLARGKDYEFDPFWGTVGVVQGGALVEGQSVFVDYVYTPCRLDAIVIDGGGEQQIALRLGEPGAGAVLPADAADSGATLARIWQRGRVEALTPENLYPISFALLNGPAASNGEQLLPKTLAKLRAGQPVTIVAWGDSVTNGGGVEQAQDLWYQYRFQAALQKRYPNATITMKTAAWPGGNSTGYLAAPAGGKYDFVRDVHDPKPDLVTIEFVNDSGLNGEALRAHYAGILERLRGNGSEVILITPHFVRPDWMNVTTLKLDEDPRPYVRDLRSFAGENNVALADASALWCRLWRQGLPYITLLANDINHPDVRGHDLFVEALLGLFPAP